MRRFRKLLISLFSIVVFLTFSGYGGMAGLSKCTSPDHIERIATAKPHYYTGNCHFNMAVSANKNSIPLRFLSFNLDVCLKANANLIFTKYKVQSKVAYLTINPKYTRILKTPHLCKDKDFYHHLLG